MTERASRHNTGKVMLELLKPEFLREMGLVLTKGAQKYAPNNWMRSINTEDHDQFVQDRLGSMFRHLLARMDGEQNDPEFQTHHMANLAINAMFIFMYDKLRKD